MLQEQCNQIADEATPDTAAMLGARVPVQRRWGDPAEYGTQTWRVVRGVRGTGYPPKGTDVVYRLYNAEDQLLYIGSSGNLRNRIGGHAAKPWTYLTARDTRGHAPGLEAVAIFTERPPLNEKQLHAWGGALQLSAAASRARVLTKEIAVEALRLHTEVQALRKALQAGGAR